MILPPLLRMQPVVRPRNWYQEAWAQGSWHFVSCLDAVRRLVTRFTEAAA
jgi:hypothetical protein